MAGQRRLVSGAQAGIAALVRGIAREEGRYAVRANVIGTGVIDAGITQAGLESGDVPQNFVDGAIQSTPLGRLGEADDIAEAVLFLASQRAKFITGQVLNVDANAQGIYWINRGARLLKYVQKRCPMLCKIPPSV